MQTIVTTDNHINGSEGLSQHVQSVVHDSLNRFGERVVRIEVHLSDENGTKGGDDDKRCAMEARLAGLPPFAVTHHAASVEEAIDGAAEKLEKVIERKLGRMHDSKERTSFSGEPT